MNKLEMEFFEEYKRLDVLLKDEFGGNAGITSYIEAMERIHNGERYVASWRDDYKRLKHLRWVRNKLAHETNEDVDLTKDDVKWIKQFYDNAMKAKDPYALYCKAIKPVFKANKGLRKTQANKQQSRKNNSTGLFKEERAFLAIVVFIIILMLLIKMLAFAI